MVKAGVLAGFLSRPGMRRPGGPHRQIAEAPGHRRPSFLQVLCSETRADPQQRPFPAVYCPERRELLQEGE